MRNILFLINILCAFNVDAKAIIGVADKDQHLYSVEGLRCPTSGKQLTESMINDGRCDCPEDGFDEPGTAACEKGKFHCKNSKGIDENIASYKVNDGVCDCCDGSDEYLDRFGVKCPNTCDTARKSLIREAYLEKAKKKKALKYFEKSKEEAKQAQEDLKSKLSEINSKIEELDNQTKEINDLKDSNDFEKVLAEYRLKLDHLDGLIANLTAILTPSNSNKSEGEEEATATPKSTWMSLIDAKLQRARNVIFKFAYQPTVTTVTKYVPTVVTKTVVQYEPTSTYEERLNDLSYEKNELLNQAKDLESSINDQSIYGPDSVFLSLRNKCFDRVDGKFTYTLCLFESAKQKEMSKGSEFTIGKWKGWDEGEDSDNPVKNYKKMVYDDGAWCNSKNRESIVHLICGWRNEIISVEETSTCLYEFKFTTPLACVF